MKVLSIVATLLLASGISCQRIVIEHRKSPLERASFDLVAKKHLDNPDGFVDNNGGGGGNPGANGVLCDFDQQGKTQSARIV